MTERIRQSIYHTYPLILRLRGDKTIDTELDCDIRSWLPGNHLENAKIEIPESLPKGEYTLEIGITGGKTTVLFANDTERCDGFTEIGKITVE